MTIAEMHWEFDFRYNKINSNQKYQFTPIEKDTLLNDAVFRFVETKYNLLDVRQKDMDAINTLIVDEVIPTSSHRLLYTALSSQYMHFINSTLTTNCGKFAVRVVQHDDIDSWLSDPLRQPSKLWRRALVTFTGDGIQFYLPDGVTLSSVNITYLKYPDILFYGTYNLTTFSYPGYNSVEYSTSGTGYQIGDPPVNCNIPDTYHHVIVDMAVEQAAKNLYDEAQIQVRQDNNKIIL